MGDGSQELTFPPAASLGISTLAGVQLNCPMACPQPPAVTLNAMECPYDNGCPFNKGYPGKLGPGRVGE